MMGARPRLISSTISSFGSVASAPAHGQHLLLAAREETGPAVEQVGSRAGK